MRLRMETVETLAEELFLLQTLGDDRAVAEVYVAGRPAKSDARLVDQLKRDLTRRSPALCP